MNTPPPKTDALKVVRVIARLNIGGPARHATILDDGLSRLGFRTLLVYGTPEASEGSMENLVKERSLRAVRIPELGRQIRPLSDLVALVRLVRLLFRERPDVVHTHTAKAGVLGRVAAWFDNATSRRRHRCFVVHTFHGHVFTGYFGPTGTIAVRLVERILGYLTNRIVTLSARQREEVTTAFRVAPASKTVVIPLGLDLAPLLTLTRGDGGGRERFGFAADAFVFGYVGRFVPVKDVDTLIRAFGVVSRSHQNAGLLLSGDGECREHLAALVSSLGIGDRVRFIGWQLDLPAVYSALDALVLSSRNEGTPVDLIEAMAAGVPVVATSVGGVPDVLDNGRCGLLVPPGDIESLARAMGQVASDGELRERLARAGREQVASRYQPQELAAAIADLYREGVRQRRSGTDLIGHRVYGQAAITVDEAPGGDTISRR